MPVCREKAIELMLASGNTVRTPPAPRTKSAAAGVEALIWARTCSSSGVTLWVVKTVATATSASRSLSGSPRTSSDMLWWRSLRNGADSIGSPLASRTRFVTTRM